MAMSYVCQKVSKPNCLNMSLHLSQQANNLVDKYFSYLSANRRTPPSSAADHTNNFGIPVGSRTLCPLGGGPLVLQFSRSSLWLISLYPESGGFGRVQCLPWIPRLLRSLQASSRMQWALLPPYPNEFTETRRRPLVGQGVTSKGNCTRRSVKVCPQQFQPKCSYLDMPIINRYRYVWTLEIDIRRYEALFKS